MSVFTKGTNEYEYAIRIKFTNASSVQTAQDCILFSQ